ncbi:hypothetical protein INT46_008949 [Mucor plumbeus]|uniref:CCHC-type domain-containing protein n=1 Tax=Mucor plumbeus TaxID=97098 RepID=A0A8H7QEU6_9FUNG|nr:hypothetical protein INT46_008949 [Mucor plumbeus]
MATQQVVVVSNSTTANQSTATKNYPVVIKPLNLEGGQCTWCGKYGHSTMICPYLR